MNTSDDDKMNSNVKKPKIIHIVDRFELLEAINSKNAIKLEQLNLDLDKYESRLKKLIEKNVLITVNSEKYYLNIENFKVYKKEEEKDLFIKLTAIIIPGLILILLGIVWIFIV